MTDHVTNISGLLCYLFIAFDTLFRCFVFLPVSMLQRCLQRNSKNRPTIEELLEHPYVTSD